ncbi:MAG TPA: hypothetical protein VF974_07980 [Patescibacteria group bacterium]
MEDRTMRRVLCVVAIMAVSLTAIACEGKVAATPTIPFPLKSVTIEGQDGQFVADAIQAEFLKKGAVYTADGVDITGTVEWTTVANNVVHGVKLNLRGIRQGGLSVASAVNLTHDELVRARVLPTASEVQGQGVFVRLAANKAVDDFRQQVLQQQNYLPKEAATKPPLR